MSLFNAVASASQSRRDKPQSLRDLIDQEISKKHQCLVPEQWEQSQCLLDGIGIYLVQTSVLLSELATSLAHG